AVSGASGGSGDQWSNTSASNPAPFKGGVYVGGCFTGHGVFGNFHPNSAGAADLFVARYDTQSHPVWVDRAGSPVDDNVAGICDVAGQGVLATGSFYDKIVFVLPSVPPAPIHLLPISRPGQRAMLLIRYDAGGAVQWAIAPTMTGGPGWGASSWGTSVAA